MLTSASAGGRVGALVSLLDKLPNRRQVKVVDGRRGQIYSIPREVGSPEQVRLMRRLPYPLGAINLTPIGVKLRMAGRSRRGEGGEEWMGGPLWSPVVALA